jgi:hypothetical protein
VSVGASAPAPARTGYRPRKVARNRVRAGGELARSEPRVPSKDRPQPLR